jgi:ubiquinone/menaquinone biosynthesis C-methylase UbiE
MARFYDAVMANTEARCLERWRAELLADASGDVLEIGAGTGINLQYYPGTVKRLVLSEPNRHMRVQLHRRIARSEGPSPSVMSHRAECIALPDASFDGIVSTLVLCSVKDLTRSLREIHRLLRPGGKLYLIEHVLAKHDPGLLRWQRFWNPLWRLGCGNCHLTQDTEAVMRQVGFSTECLEAVCLLGAPAVVRHAIMGPAIKQRTLYRSL